MTSLIVYFQKLSENAHLRKNTQAFDHRSAHNYVIMPRNNVLIKTDLAIKIPDTCYGRITPHSGLTPHHDDYFHS